MKFIIFLLFFMIFMIFSVPEKDNLQLRLYVSLIYYSTIFLSFIIVQFFSKKKFKLKYNEHYYIIIIFILFFWTILFTETHSFYCFKILANFLIGFLAYKLILVYKEKTTKALKAILSINIIAIFFQFLYTYITGDFFNLHAELFPFSRQETTFLEFDRFYRFSGLHYEPGNYSILISLLILMLFFLDKNKNYVFYFAAIISIILTKSVLGILFSILLSFIVLREKYSVNFSFVKFVLSLTIVFSIIKFTGAYDYILLQTSDHENFRSFQSKITTYNMFLNREFYEIFFGSGIHSDEIIRNSNTKGLIKDNGLLFNLIYSFGILGVFLSLSSFIKYKSNSFFEKLIIFTILAISKIGFLYPALFVFVIFFLQNNYILLKQKSV